MRYKLMSFAILGRGQPGGFSRLPTLFDSIAYGRLKRHRQVYPPSATTIEPVMRLARSEARTEQGLRSRRLHPSAPSACSPGVEHRLVPFRVGAKGPISALCDITLLVETLDNPNVYTLTASRIAALVPVDILSTAVAPRRESSHLNRLSHMKQRLDAFRSGDAEPESPA